MGTDDLEWLGTWYSQQCDGRWEHQRGMLLEPLTGPKAAGWRLRIDLRGTAVAGCAPRRLTLYEMKGAWLRCALSAQRFEGEGAEVEPLIGVFRRWIEDRSPLLGAVSTG